MGLSTIRAHYGVPAKRGARVRFSGDTYASEGVIVGSRGSYLRVRLDGETRTRLYHPTWGITYLEAKK